MAARSRVAPATLQFQIVMLRALRIKLYRSDEAEKASETERGIAFMVLT